MKLNLKPVQLRVLGCLIEKQLTTPEYYPLTLSALTNACNQKSNREPVMSLSESDVLDAVKQLEGLYLAREKQLPGARVAKYEHKLTGTLTDQFGFTDKEVAVLSILFLRGPQTPGEIRTRTQRSCNFNDVSEVDRVLTSLAEKNANQYVKALPRQVGKREIRYCHLFAGDLFIDNLLTNSTEAQERQDNTEHSLTRSLSISTSDVEITKIDNQIIALQQTVAQMQTEINALKAQVTQLINQN